MRHVFVSLGLALNVLGACRAKTPEQEYTGEIPLVFVNQTDQPLCSIELYVAYSVRIQDDLKGEPCIPPGGQREFHLLAKQYEIRMWGPHSHTFSASTTKLALSEPTQIVIWDTAPPAASTGTGMKLIAVESDKHHSAILREQADAKAHQQHETCAAHLPPDNERPSPGKTKATGKWKCVLGGSFTGTDYVDLVQLADGHISATVSGADRSMTWTGAVVGDEVHFRWGEGGLEGGVLKLDPSARAMSGKIYTFNKNKCEAGTFTCTR